jgi:hypothetical protein
MSKSDTPRTDAQTTGNSDPQQDEYEDLLCFTRMLERELTAARAEIERLDTVGIHSCHDNCQRWTCVLRRERDELATCLASEKITRNHIVELASETERELAAVTEQRDRLAVALQLFLNRVQYTSAFMDGKLRGGTFDYRSSGFDGEVTQAYEALQSLTTNAETIYGEKGSTP